MLSPVPTYAESCAHIARAVTVGDRNSQTLVSENRNHYGESQLSLCTYTYISILYINRYIYIHVYIHTYMHTYICIYISENVLVVGGLWWRKR
jgi:hypothetical protein